MPGEVDLSRLLGALSPQLLPGEFVFCTLPDAVYGDHAPLSPIASFREPEGLTLVLERNSAESAALAFEAVFRCITLNVQSSLVAVGLTAAVSGALAQQGISANVIAACYHDHIFVPVERAADAMGALRELGGLGE